MNATFRKSLSWLHTWSGLTLGLAIVMLAITGAGLVVRLQLDSLVNRDLLVVPACSAPLSLDLLTERAQAVHPEGALRAIDLTASTTASTAVQFQNRDYVYFDPCSGEVLGMQNQYDGFFGTLDEWHRFRFMDWVYRTQLAGWITVVFLAILIIGGVVLWWPRSKSAVKGAFKFHSRLPGTARTLSLHKVIGLYTSIALVLITITALPVSFNSVRDLIYKMTGYVTPEIPQSAVQASTDYYSMEAAWQKTQQHFPELEKVSLNFRKSPEEAIRIEVFELGRPHQNAKSLLFLDAWSGEVLALRGYAADMGLGRKIYLYSIALHAALVGGLPYQMLLLIAALAIPVQAYSGFSPYLRRKFRAQPKTTLALQLAGKTLEAKDICSFEIADPGGKELPPFSAGAHIDVHIGKKLTRQYSLCNDPRDKHRYVIGVLRDPESRGGSISMHEDFKIGSTLEISGPRNHFPLADDAESSLLIAGGIGVTPILSMAEQLSSKGADFAMHYCVRSQDRAAFMDRIRRSAFAGKVSLYSSEQGDRLDIPATLGACRPGTHLYVCGPAKFMEAVINTAREQGWPDAQVHREYFEAAGHDTTNDVAFDVKIASTGKVIHVPKDKTVVAVLAEHGIDIPTSCSEGVCATCLTTVLEGEVEHNDMVLSEEQRAQNNQFMPCCSRGRGPFLVLDL